MRRPNIIRITKNRVPMKTLNRKVMGSGAFLLDGGMGGQNSYHSIEDYEQTTGRKLNAPKGRGLADKIGERLSKINIDKKVPKKKNITMNF